MSDRTRRILVYVEGEPRRFFLGLRVRHGHSYHGLALNVAMDLAPFARINPCGYQGLAVTQLADLGVPLTPEQAGSALAEELAAVLDIPLVEADSTNPVLGAAADSGAAG